MEVVEQRHIPIEPGFLGRCTSGRMSFVGTLLIGAFLEISRSEQRSAAFLEVRHQGCCSSYV